MKQRLVDDFIAALLRCDQKRCREILDHAVGDQFTLLLFTEIFESGLPNLLIKRLYQLELDKHFANRMVYGKAFLQEVSAALSRLFVGSERMNEQFLQLLVDLAELSQAVVWLKGVSLSRSLYEEPFDRLSNDFDLLIAPESLPVVYERLKELGFNPLWQDPGHCHQYLSGPTGSLEDISTLPSGELVPYNVTMLQADWTMLELKCDPLDMGVRFKEYARFIAERQQYEWKNRRFLAPSNVDHLLLELTHFHKHGLRGWSWIYDMHLLTQELSKNEDCWREFVRRCQIEGVCASAYIGLTELTRWLASPVPEWVLKELEQAAGGALFVRLARHANIAFLWNCRSFPELVYTAVFGGDSKRKFEILAACLFPDDNFIRAYYCGGMPTASFNLGLAKLFHFLVLLLPAGITRRSLGFLWWRPRS